MQKESDSLKDLSQKATDDSLSRDQSVEFLYRKNAHLLDRLSKTGRENTYLQIKLSSLKKEKSQLGDKNILLKNKFANLKKQISMFAKQHKEFNSMSLNLKKQLDQARQIKVSSSFNESPSFFKKESSKNKADKAYLFKKKEEVYTKQIQSLQASLKAIKSGYDKQISSSKEEWHARKQNLDKQNHSLIKEKNLLEEQIQESKKEKRQLLEKLETETAKSQEQAHEKTQSLRQKLEEKEKINFHLAGEIQLLNKKNSFLKFNMENFKKALSLEGQAFEQNFFSFRKKYGKLYNEKENLEAKYKTLIQKQESLKEDMSQAQAKENQGKIKQINELQGELDVIKIQNAELKKTNQCIKMDLEAGFLEKIKTLEKSMQNLKWEKERACLNWEQKLLEEKEQTKQNYEAQIENLEKSFRRQKQNLLTETENDLCQEKKRFEVFKNIKEQDMKELKSSWNLLSEENQKLKNQKFLLEKSLFETKDRLDRQIKELSSWKKQAEKLNGLWKDLQSYSEKKDQQISSLQKLNKSLSLSLNKQKPAGFKEQDLKSNTEDKKSSSHILAELHFE